MRYFKCIVEYDGTQYSGWQRQKNTPWTIQEKIEEALQILVKKPVSALASSRTDAGVHAQGQVIGFHLDCRIPLENLPLAINRLLPGNIRVRQAEEVSQDFHPRYDAKGKLYQYYVDNQRIRSVFRRNYAYHIPTRLNLDAMKMSSHYLLGTKDFSSFRALGCVAKSAIRTLERIEIKQLDDSLVCLEFLGDGFLYNMVRILSGTLLNAGLDKFTPKEVQEILLAKDRDLAGPTLPAHGLYLVQVFY